jgi:hypothetical protein
MTDNNAREGALRVAAVRALTVRAACNLRKYIGRCCCAAEVRAVEAVSR